MNLGRSIKTHAERKDWWAARSTCQREGADLVTIDQPEVNDILAMEMLGELWIGARYQVRHYHLPHEHFALLPSP